MVNSSRLKFPSACNSPFPLMDLVMLIAIGSPKYAASLLNTSEDC